jgi:N-acetylmuramoyl-L-alanine amidase
MKPKNSLLVILIALTLFVSLCAEHIYARWNEPSVETLLYWGTRGDRVLEVQRKLRQWDFYDGPLSGVYGPETFEAVRSFQRRHGLKADGVVGSRTAAAMGIRLDGGVRQVRYTQARGGGGNRGDLYMLARLVYGEARGEPYSGMVAVAAVTLNRVRSPLFPNTIAGVIYQPGAFTAVSDGQFYLEPNEEAFRAARDAMNGWDPTGGALYFFNPATSTSRWIWTRRVHMVIGRHRFAR